MNFSRPITVGRRFQAGVALITAVLIVALASIAAAALLVSANIAIHRTENMQNSEMAWWYADGLEQWVVMLLQRDMQTHSVDSLNDAWARQVVYLPIDQGSITGNLEDLQGRFNLNNLGAVDPAPYIQQFVRLIGALPGRSDTPAQDIAGAIRDWIDSDSDVYPIGGAEDSYYLSLHPTHRTAGRLMTTPSELLQVKGMTPELYAALRPYIATLPTTSARININTASAPVLSALSDHSDFDASFMERRLHDPVTSIQQLTTEGLVAKGVDLGQFADVHTQYFLLHAQIVVGNGHLELFSVIVSRRGSQPAVIQHSLGTE